MTGSRGFLVATVSGLLVSATAGASVVQLPHTSGEIMIDGVIDEAAWQDAVAVDVNIETEPGENIPAAVMTTAYIVEDGENLYIAFDAEDPEPSKIRAYLRDRDSAWNDDFVGVVLDTYGDQRRAFEFFVNPLGVQMDLTNDDINQREDASWDAIWTSAGRITDTGFVVEMQIPLNQLRFQQLDGRQTWGIDLLRMYPRDRRYRLSNNVKDRDRNCYLCQFGHIQGLEGAEPSRDIEVVPTITASQVDSTDQPGILPLQSGDADIEGGLNVRWGITPDLTANLAINPDFSQVEADAAQLEINNQFALFFPEKRPFFLEGADYFSTPIQAVFTRTVADPLIGAKLTGKRDAHTFGVFLAQDETTNLLFPGAFGSDSTSLDQENATFVGRYSLGIGDASSVGALVTARDGTDYHNYVGGLDMRWKFDDHHSVRAQVLRSDTEYPAQVAADFSQPAGSFSGTATRVNYDYDSRNWFVYAIHQSQTSGFRADSGFVPRVNIDQQVIGVGRVWHGDEDNWYSKLRLIVDWDIAHDDDGRVLERELETRFGFDGPLQSFVRFGLGTTDILFNDVMFEEESFFMFGEFQPVGGLVAGMWNRWGTRVDFANTRLGDERRIQPFFNWNVNRNLLVRFDGALVKLDTQQGANIFDAKIYDVRLTWQFNLRSFLRLTTQIQDIERNPAEYIDPVETRSRNVGRQLLYSYKINPQTVFFLGYSDSLLDDDSLTELTTTDRSWFMKIGYAWTP